jgi:copper chaperone
MAEQITLNAPDISCEHCVATVQKAVGALPGVDSVSASADTKDIAISFDPGNVSDDQIAAVLDEEGYPVAK